MSMKGNPGVPVVVDSRCVLRACLEIRIIRCQLIGTILVLGVQVQYRCKKFIHTELYFTPFTLTHMTLRAPSDEAEMHFRVT